MFCFKQKTFKNREIWYQYSTNTKIFNIIYGNEFLYKNISLYIFELQIQKLCKFLLVWLLIYYIYIYHI